YEDVFDRWPSLRGLPSAAIPIGVEPSDFDMAGAGAHTGRHFNPDDGCIHLCSVGTIVPMGLPVVGTVLAALAVLRSRGPELAARLRLHFFGTSNERSTAPADRVLP